MKNLFLLLSALLIAACNPDDSNIGTNVDILIKISVKNNLGIDLLDPKNPNSFQESDITLFYVQDGKATEYYKSNLRYPRGFFISQDENEYRRLMIYPNTGIYPNTEKIDDFPMTLIQWNSNDTDTIKCSIVRKSNSMVCNKVWFNEKLVWEAYATDRFFEIIK